MTLAPVSYSLLSRNVTFSWTTYLVTLSQNNDTVLEGDLTPAGFESLKVDVRKIIDEKYDSVLFYVWRVERYMKREVVGVERGSTDFVV